MLVGYLAHPLSAPSIEEIERNRRNASKWAAWLCRSGISPCCSWIVLTGELPETPENRALGLACDLAQVEKCDALFLVGGRVSSGMALERQRARDRLCPVYDLTPLGWSPPAELWGPALFRRLEAMQDKGRDARGELPTLPDASVAPLRMMGPDRALIESDRPLALEDFDALLAHEEETRG